MPVLVSHTGSAKRQSQSSCCGPRGGESESYSETDKEIVSGIGQQIAVYFAKRGCSKIFLVDISDSGLQETDKLVKSAASNVNTTLYKVDVSKDESVKAMVDKCIEVYGRLDFACNNAGIAMANVSTAETDIKTFERVHDVNFKGVCYGPSAILLFGHKLTHVILRPGILLPEI